ncbi:hypothetical protein [Novosphingobium sp. Leaf2]|uniref:hypothetical protein n=1 Tax=Novosphingobium sp. Leaf2 TaxID=1735670 RepID=UPI0006FA3096|nr:hypothetical protein [Novosphingobium sp. Leaf2]KQM22025.1 hypothetical protein ASE49_01585 [Novosphingobium sp. Leaf2]
MIDRPDDLAPETTNNEQEDEDTQSQTVTDQAMDRNTAAQGLSDTEKVKGGIQDEDNITDIVDHMNQMDRSGTIDMSAYDGEETMDDLENRYGTRNAADDQFAGDDS